MQTALEEVYVVYSQLVQYVHFNKAKYIYFFVSRTVRATSVLCPSRPILRHASLMIGMKGIIQTLPLLVKKVSSSPNTVNLY